jgi:hypothetical protein
MLRAFVNCAMVLTKRCHFLPFLYFPIVKGGTKTIVHLSIAEGLSFRSLDRCIYDCKLRNEKDLIQVRNEISLPTSKLVVELLAIKKQGGALIL